MKKVTYNNKEYVRVSEVAKKFRYTTDYVGQLCRAGKVDARRVGRVWYVTLDSVKNYRKTKYKSSGDLNSTNPSTVVSMADSGSVQVPITRRKRRVPPVTRAKTLRIATGALKPRETATQGTYSHDETATVPIVLAKSGSQTSRAVRIEKTRAVSIPVKRNTTEETSFLSEKLPEISLSGSLSVTSFSEEDLSEGTSESHAEVVVDDTLGDVSKVVAEAGQAVGLETVDNVQKMAPEKSGSDGKELEESTQPHAALPSVHARSQEHAARVSVVWVSYVAALLLAGVILGLGSTAVVGSGEYSGHLIFDIKNFQNLAQLFP